MFLFCVYLHIFHAKQPRIFMSWAYTHTCVSMCRSLNVFVHMYADTRTRTAIHRNTIFIFYADVYGSPEEVCCNITELLYTHKVNIKM
jgi:hypothetical protein